MTNSRTKLVRNRKDRMLARISLAMSVFSMASPHVIADEGDEGQGERQDVKEGEPGRVEQGPFGEDLGEGPRRIDESRVLDVPFPGAPVVDEPVDERVLVADDLTFETALLGDPRAGDLARRIEEAGGGRDAVDVAREPDQPLELQAVVLFHPVGLGAEGSHALGPVPSLADAEKDFARPVLLALFGQR